eukprot:scaffold37146_cov67-Phaeocystis_antarctica.AAC.10
MSMSDAAPSRVYGPGSACTVGGLEGCGRDWSIVWRELASNACSRAYLHVHTAPAQPVVSVLGVGCEVELKVGVLLRYSAVRE